MNNRNWQNDDRKQCIGLPKSICGPSQLLTFTISASGDIESSPNLNCPLKTPFSECHYRRAVLLIWSGVVWWMMMHFNDEEQHNTTVFKSRPLTALKLRILNLHNENTYHILWFPSVSLVFPSKLLLLFSIQNGWLNLANSWSRFQYIGLVSM